MVGGRRKKKIYIKKKKNRAGKRWCERNKLEGRNKNK